MTKMISKTPPTTPKKTIIELEERRAKRAEKRLKQRANNYLRAKEMHKARLEHLKLPISKKTKSENPTKPSARLHIGCSGWYYWHWKGPFYPATLAGNKWFDHYVKNFETVELNAPFYSWPTSATVRSWIRQAKDQPIVYTVKVCELITHVKRFKGTKTLIKDFSYIADLLGDHMGCFLFQLPPSFHFTRGRLKAVTGQLDPARRNVVEFRHSSWWTEEVYKAFRNANIIFCSCSGPKLPDELIKTADDIYIRFHGTSKWYFHNYSEAELKVWAKRIYASGAQQVWAYFNNDRDAYATKNAHELVSLLRKHRRPK